jgi:hypothetical protein
VIIMNWWNCRFSVIKSKAAALSWLIGTAYSDIKCGLKTGWPVSLAGELRKRRVETCIRRYE